MLDSIYMEDDRIIALLEERDSASFADIIDIMRSGEAETLFFSPDEGLICRHCCGTYFIADLGEGMAGLEKALPSEGLASVHGERIARHMKERMGYKGEEPTILFSWDRSEVPPEDSSIRVLGTDWVPFVVERYGTSSEEDVQAAAKRGRLFGAFSDDGGIMGFAGFHEEGSMGMLVVLPEYRRQGVGERLERHLIRSAMLSGGIPYCNVFISNSASLSLQAKLGLREGSVRSWWLWTE